MTMFHAIGEAAFESLERFITPPRDPTPNEERLRPIAEAITATLWYVGFLTLLPLTLLWLLTHVVPFSVLSLLCWAPCWLGCLILPPVKGEALFNLLLCAYASCITLETDWLITRAALCIPMAVCLNQVFTMALLSVEELYRACTGRAPPTRVFWEKHDAPCYLPERLELLSLLMTTALPLLLLRWWMPIPATPMLKIAYPVWAAAEELLPRLQPRGSLWLGSSRLVADAANYLVPIAACAYHLRDVEACPIYGPVLAGMLTSVIFGGLHSALQIVCGRKRLGALGALGVQMGAKRRQKNQRH